MSESQFLLKEETHRIIGCSLEVINEICQMLNSLKVTGLHVGLLINFKNANLEWKRVAR